MAAGNWKLAAGSSHTEVTVRWTSGDRSNVEDARGSSGGMRAVPFGIGGVIVLALLSMYTGVDFLSMFSGGDGAPTSTSVGTSGGGNVATTPEEEKMVDFVDAVTRDAQE